MGGRAETLVQLLYDAARRGGDRPAVLVKREGRFAARSWSQLSEDVSRAAAALVRLGVGPGDRIVQVAENRYEWIAADLAIQTARAIHVPVHATLAGEQIAAQIADAGAGVVLLSGEEQAAKVAAAGHLPRQVEWLCYDECSTSIGGQAVRLLADLTSRIDAAEAAQVRDDALAGVKSGDVATILYTSGTTGEPKGVMLTHGNFTSNTWGTIDAFGFQRDEMRLCFLPLSHVFARTCDLYTSIALGTPLALAEGREQVLANCAEVRPTVISGVPYFYAKVADYLRQGGTSETPAALEKLLGGRMRVCCSGGAALPDHVAEFFAARGVPLVQGYGLTETSPVITLSTPRASRLGTVGRAIGGVEVRIAGDGEILTRGPHVMAGYYGKPRATAAILRDGWLHTGDVGTLDDDGYLRITGRKKELIVTAGGKNVAPVYLEALLEEDPLIAQAMIVGDGRSFLAALIVPQREPLVELIRDEAIAVTSAEQALAHPRVLEIYRQRIDARLACVSRDEQVRRFRLLDRGFTIEGGELTPTLKLRRGVIAGRLADEIEAMYAPEM